ncbi:flagellar motor protein [Paenibacillus sp. JCM 10914]|uniref:flagellar motor protein n=1 Tax=Paenibacillus sp. JCM 10914 TaxID=1236974 RepID=UPI0003CC339A|nr:flagellar motor protein [Paenibacillus sp. JCM 10914]GAE09140.1 flagellar motor rotation protein MotA [Paenibacillus sp. JCM 10914]
MDITIILGIIAGLAALIGGFLWEGGHISGLLQGAAALIVFGGTFAAVMISFPLARLRTIPAALKLAFGRSDRSSDELIDSIVEMSVIARKDGVLALERISSEHSDPFLNEGMQMVVDGSDPETVRQILELEITAAEQKHEGYAKIFESAGGYAPTMGIIGTVMGLIHVLGSLQSPTDLGSSIAVAFTATLYGVVSANIIFLPIASKIKARSEEEIANMELILEGVVSVQNGEHPLLIRKKLTSFASGGSANIPSSRGIAHETAE